MSMGFNCTIMELKSRKGIENVVKVVEVLIVPLWNWNTTKSVINTYQYDSFNCTIMELKFGKRLLSRFFYSVLIVPLWNWNNEVKDIKTLRDAF